jgi:hypothetical protein
MERLDACVEFHALYEYCGCKFEELKHNELHQGMKKICHFVQPHYVIVQEKCDKCKTHPFSPGRQGTRIYKAIHIPIHGVDCLHSNIPIPSHRRRRISSQPTPQT